MPRTLSPEERALWRRVTADLRRDPSAPDPVPTPMLSPEKAYRSSLPREPAVSQKRLSPAATLDARWATLDARWDRQLATGDVAPDRTVDLHGCTLETAHRRAISALQSAVRHGDRVVVLVTGKPPKTDASRLETPLRGVIRASIGDWIAASPVAGHVAAIRPAHRRHGGSGALYVVLRRANRSIA